MTLNRVAKASAVYMLVVMLAGIAAVLWPTEGPVAKRSDSPLLLALD